MSKIIPSTKLRVLSVHKIWNMSCLRFYFWRWIRNLEPKSLNLNFYYGGLLGAGIEQLLKDGKYLNSKMDKVLKSESKSRSQGHVISPEDKSEMSLQYQLVKASLQGVVKRPFFKKMKITKSQVKVSYSLTKYIKFHGTMDGLGLYKNKPCSFEFKTATQVSHDLFTALQYDKQVYGYVAGLKLLKKSYPKTCCYLIFRKTSKKVKKNQTKDEFIQEIKADIGLIKAEGIKPRPEFYYIHHPITLGKETAKFVQQSITASARLLETIYNSMSKRELLDPISWPCNERQCLSFGTCPFILLCKYPKRWETYAHLFRQREMLYEEEREELKQ